jgi:hypothetical protein
VLNFACGQLYNYLALIVAMGRQDNKICSRPDDNSATPEDTNINFYQHSDALGLSLKGQTGLKLRAGISPSQLADPS